MKISLFTNQLNHHQAPISDCLYELTNGDFRFIEINSPNNQSKKGSSIDYSLRPYLVQAWRNKSQYSEAEELARESDVCIFGAESIHFEILRAQKTDLLSFEMSERWLKRGYLNALSPRFIQYQWFYHTLFFRKPVYKLCAGAYSANDQYLFHSFRNRCYKWGYFVLGANDERSFKQSSSYNKIQLMWCGRFLSLKHPELAIDLAYRLKYYGISFHLDMYGSGPLFNDIKKRIIALELSELVTLHGSVDNSYIINEMLNHDVLLLTSDRNEGWGAVVNEALSCGCAVIASNAIGCVPYLIKPHETGCVFRDQNIDSLLHEFFWLIDSEERINQIRKNSSDYYYRFWTPHKASQALINLIACLKTGQDTAIEEGPCSKAFPTYYSRNENKLFTK